MSDGRALVVQVHWQIAPFRGDKFEDFWKPVAESALDFGATGWAFFRAQDGMQDFMQYAFFEDKAAWDRYWYSEEVSRAREEIEGWFQWPLIPDYYFVSGMGSLAPSADTL